jgi:hypothetical protein
MIVNEQEARHVLRPRGSRGKGPPEEKLNDSVPGGGEASSRAQGVDPKFTRILEDVPSQNVNRRINAYAVSFNSEIVGQTLIAPSAHNL